MSLVGCTNIKPPPPMLPASGQVTARAKPTATAASTALPPFLSTAAPASDAGAETDTTMPLRPSALWLASAVLARAQKPSKANNDVHVLIGELSWRRKFWSAVIAAHSLEVKDRRSLETRQHAT